MPGRKSVWLQGMYRLLQDCPCDREELIRACVHLVPPAQALRTYENEARSNGKSQGYNAGIRGASHATKISVGSRSIVRKSLWVATKNGHFVVLEDGRIAINPDRT